VEDPQEAPFDRGSPQPQQLPAATEQVLVVVACGDITLTILPASKCKLQY
jgi:hypothetical protein